MRVIRCINNNVAICIDGNNRELVAFGKGIGFKKPPYEVPLKAIERTFYDIDNTLVGMIQGIDERVINVSAKIADYARSIIDKPLSSNIVFALADHIDFAIGRNKGAKTITMPIIYDVQYLYEKEYKIGEYAISLIRDELKEYLPKEEAGYIALHFINAQSEKTSDTAPEQIVESITKIIEDKLKLSINRDGANYSRFVTHMHYLLKRGDKQTLHATENVKMYESLSQQYPQISECVDIISSYFEKVYGMALNEEEKLYLILHVNRLLVREETE